MEPILLLNYPTGFVALGLKSDCNEEPEKRNRGTAHDGL